ncbi:MAG TPA: hypothetical protein RMH85_15955 [Polyangiaceae bacterium LLY-WYZ-15_(1-7)]|nr:hypothetical protein [Polyangiaceae bacterium LLY-WYZ-15_(1-7)]HJL01144.1 hypothetical protein [Polyangiaceae bacterium LLY-WYZ-15_(1-7)]HJL09995.1 hypothetical protein [Polyangiaceae bacterium LLY-WYZ-15_(1-7)]HJL20831.1 hypothetical protein [Polyangiaceae bacterium LLY-WYZ-15_(1-7)]HJL37993.1 hypothetical protein [Polyangiaceae bacterium LLY-WYZ-15_(1-7)]
MRRGVALGLALLLSASLLAPGAARADDPWWGRDKALHLSLSAAITLGAYGVVALVDEREPLRFGVAAAIGAGAGLGKELVDALREDGDPSGRDLFWDAVGVASGLLFGWLLGIVVRAARGEPPLVGSW